MSWLYVIIVGLIAGWIAGLLTKGRGFGILGNIVVGIIGALIGGWVEQSTSLSIGNGTTGQIVTSVLGAVLLILALRVFRI